MYIYNVTVKIDLDVETEWLKWMKEVHIPDVMNTGFFLENNIFKVMLDEDDGATYSVQYNVANLEDLQEYQDNHAPRLQKDHAARYANKFVAFRSLLKQA